MDSLTMRLEENWKFHLGEAEDAWYKGYDDSSWRDVVIPHDWSVEQPFSQEYSSGTGYLAGTGFVLHCRRNTGGRKSHCCSTEYIKTARYGATAITWENVPTAMSLLLMTSAKRPFLGIWTMR